MGQLYTKPNWQDNLARAMLPAYARAFGRPYIKVNKKYGAAIWYKNAFRGKKLYGNNICFQRIMLIDDPVKPLPLWVFIDLDISDAKYKEMLPISQRFGYDRSRNHLWINGKCMTEVIVLAKLLTDVAVGNNTTENIIINDLVFKSIMNARGNPGLKAEMYMQLCENLIKNKQPKTENFSGIPWYTVNQPYSSNNPLHIAMQEGNDRAYYEILDQVLQDKKSSDSVYAFPRAATGKPSLENLLDMPQNTKMKERATSCQARDSMINYDAYGEKKTLV